MRYVHKFTFSGEATFRISGTATICDLQLERGTIATDWKPSPLDNDKTAARFQSIQYIADAIKNGSVDMLGGLILANILMLGNYRDGEMQKVTAGISGIYNDDDDVYAWGGGTLEQAIRAVMAYKENPDYEPTEAELRDMANIVLTHGGRAILNDVIVRGYIHALGGVFRGTMYAEDGEFNGMVRIAGGRILLNKDGSGRLANGSISWDKDGNPVIKGGRFAIESSASILEIRNDPEYGPVFNLSGTDDEVSLQIRTEYLSGKKRSPVVSIVDPNDYNSRCRIEPAGVLVEAVIDSVECTTEIRPGRILITRNDRIVWDIDHQH